MAKKTNPNQCDMILDHLNTHGHITALEALNLYGCFRLAARINDLKNQGHSISSEPWVTPGGAKIAKYSLATPEQQDLPLHLTLSA